MQSCENRNNQTKLEKYNSSSCRNDDCRLLRGLLRTRNKDCSRFGAQGRAGRELQQVRNKQDGGEQNDESDECDGVVFGECQRA